MLRIHVNTIFGSTAKLFVRAHHTFATTAVHLGREQRRTEKAFGCKTARDQRRLNTAENFEGKKATRTSTRPIDSTRLVGRVCVDRAIASLRKYKLLPFFIYLFYLGDDEAEADEERDRLAHLHHRVPAACSSQA